MGYFRKACSKLCQTQRIDGVIRFGYTWMLPKTAEKPYDLRIKKLKERGDKGYDTPDKIFSGGCT